MKKSLLTLPVLMFCGFASAFGAPYAVQVTSGNLWNETRGMMALGISNNGRYICGTTVTWEGFIYDRIEEKLITTAEISQSKIGDQGANEFYAVSNDGIAFGSDGNGGITLSMDGEYNVFEKVRDPYIYITVKGVTADGSMAVGYVNPGYTDFRPCYWENGEIHILPYPTSEEVGFNIKDGASAIGVSADGNIIIGHLENRAKTYPFIYWKRLADGSYEYVGAFEGNYEDSRDVDGNIKSAYTTGMPVIFQPAAVSSDGNKVAIYVQRVKNNQLSPWEVAVYDIPSDSYTPIDYNSDNLLYEDENNFFYITGITSDGYMAGFTGYPTGPNTPFILVPGEYNDAKTLTQMFPGVELLEEYEDFCLDYHPLYLLTGMSADASVIAGYIEVFMDIDSTMPGFATYYVETGLNSGNSEVGKVTPVEEGSPVYYTVDGISLRTPAKGLNIMRKPDGSTSKIFVK